MRQGGGVEGEKEGGKDRTLRDTSQKRSMGGRESGDLDRLRAVREIGREEVKSRT